MTAPLEIKCNWTPNVQLHELERGTQAEITISLKGRCVTLFLDQASNRFGVSPKLSAHRLAVWLAANWWRLRWEPHRYNDTDWEMSHNMAAVGGGYLWPSITFSSDGETILAQSRATPTENTEPIRYQTDYICSIDPTGFEEGVDSFIDHTVRHLSRTDSEETSLKELWAEVERERQIPELHDLRKLEAYLGYDPGEAPEDLVTNLMDARERYGVEAVHEMAAASRDLAATRLSELNEDLQRSSNIVQVVGCRAITTQMKTWANNPSIPPWRRAAQAARTAREVWNLPAAGPIGTGTICDLFGVPKKYLTENNRNQPFDLRELSAGLRADETQDGFRIALHQPRETGRRFTLSRLIADYLNAPEGHLFPATQAKTSRQKFQRAFAQEFLCPFNDLMGFMNTSSPGEEDIEDAAAHFNVSPLTITRTLEHKGILEPEIPMELEV